MTARTLRFVEPHAVAIESHPEPVPGPQEVLVEGHASLVSAGTELLIYRGEAPDSLVADEVFDTLQGDLSYPLEYGYALTGAVTEVGSSVPRRWADRSVFAFAPHASHAVAPPEALVAIPEGVGGETAAFLPIAETAVNLVLDAAPRLGERVVVFGAGLVGLLTVAALSSFPLADLTVVEPVAARRERAATLGADETVAPGDLDGGTREPDLAIEVSGAPAALDEAVSLLGYDGRVVVGSWYGQKRVDLDLGGHFHRDRIEVVSSQVSTISPELRGRWSRERRMARAWELLRTVPTAELITHRVPIEEAGRAYRLLDADPESALAVLLTYG